MNYFSYTTNQIMPFKAKHVLHTSIDNDWILQETILAFRVFNQPLTSNNIYMILKIIFE